MMRMTGMLLTIYTFSKHLLNLNGATSLPTTFLIYYAQDRLLYPHHLEYVYNLPYYGYIGVACVNKDNKIIGNYRDYQIDLFPTTKDIEDLCGFISNEIKRMKEFIKLKKMKDDF